MSLNMKKYLLVSAAVAGLTVTAGQANAQTTVDVGIITDSAITVVNGNDMDFGTWFLVFRNADPFELVMTTAGIVTTANMGGNAADSLAANLVAVNQQADMTVDIPNGANNMQLNMTRGAITDFPDAGLTFVLPTYATATQGANQAFPTPAAVPVTVVSGATPEVVSFGGTIQVTATPASATHAASFTVNFAY